jgi:hypothetical protein
VHLELFAAGRVVSIPAGIGVAPPQSRRGAYVLAGRCSYPLRTLEPTGLIQARAGAPMRLGDFFSIWGQPLSARRMGPFGAARDAAVRAYVDGRRWPGDVRLIPLSRHAQIVLEVGPFVPPHRVYRFPPAL